MKIGQDEFIEPRAAMSRSFKRERFLNLYSARYSKPRLISNPFIPCESCSCLSGLYVGTIGNLGTSVMLFPLLILRNHDYLQADCVNEARVSETLRFCHPRHFELSQLYPCYIRCTSHLMRYKTLF